MAAENSDRDLFGDPVVARQEGRGRPEHIWTLENSNKVLLAFARGRSVKQTALAIGVSVPTLRKHYFSEVAERDAAHLRFEATQLHRLNELAKGGNVSAEKTLMKTMERARLEQLAHQVADRGKGQAKPKVEKLGKKEAANAAAKGVKGKFAPPPAPLLN